MSSGVSHLFFVRDIIISLFLTVNELLMKSIKKKNRIDDTVRIHVKASFIP